MYEYISIDYYARIGSKVQKNTNTYTHIEENEPKIK